MTNKLIRRGPLRRRIRKAFIQICLNLKTQHHCKSQKRYMTRSRQWKQFKQFFIYSLARNLREHPVFSSQVSSFTRREKPDALAGYLARNPGWKKLSKGVHLSCNIVTYIFLLPSKEAHAIARDRGLRTVEIHAGAYFFFYRVFLEEKLEQKLLAHCLGTPCCTLSVSFRWDLEN